MIRSKTEVLKSIQAVVIRTKTGKRQVEYRAHIGMQDGRRIRPGSFSKAELIRKVEKWYADRALAGESFVQLTRKEAMDAVLALSIIRGHNCTSSLTSIVEAHFRASGETVVAKPLMEAYDEYLKTCVSGEQTHSVRNRVGKFVAKHAALCVNAVTTEHVLAHLKSIEPCSPRTWNNNMLYLKTFFNWCAKRVRRYCQENPIADLEKKQIEAKMPEYANPNTVAELFRCAEANTKHRDSVLYWLTLSYFCGMRMAEIERQDPADVRIEEGSVIVRKPKGYTRGISHRTFHIPDVAAAWLRTIDFAKVAADPISYKTFAKLSVEIEKAVEGKIPNNAGRHTFITMHIAAYGEPQKTLGIVGTSEGMRRKNYEGVGVTKAEAEAYFAIRPRAA